MKKFKLIVVAYSHVEREFFPTKASYDAEIEVEDRASEVVKEVKKLGIEVKGIPGNQYSLYRGADGGNDYRQQPELNQKAFDGLQHSHPGLSVYQAGGGKD